MSFRADPILDELLGDDFFPHKEKPGHMGNVSVVKLKSSHHRLAQLIATGASYIDVAVAGGYTPQYISNLATANPAFQELVAHYTRQAEAEMLDLRAKQARLGEMAVDELTDRIAEDPNQFSIRELLEVVDSNANKPRLMEIQKGWSAAGPPSPITISFVTAGQGELGAGSPGLTKTIEVDKND
jgi:hypothetical protein